MTSKTAGKTAKTKVKTQVTGAVAAVPIVSTVPVVPVVPVPKTPEKKSYRLSIVLSSGRDFILQFSTIAAATAEAEQIIKQGFAVEDRTADSSRINTVLHPLAQIKSLNVYEDR